MCRYTPACEESGSRDISHINFNWPWFIGYMLCCEVYIQRVLNPTLPWIVNSINIPITALY